jgi:hypothetical protein
VKPTDWPRARHVRQSTRPRDRGVLTAVPTTGPDLTEQDVRRRRREPETARRARRSAKPCAGFESLPVTAPCRLNDENSRGKVLNVCKDSSAVVQVRRASRKSLTTALSSLTRRRTRWRCSGLGVGMACRHGVRPESIQRWYCARRDGGGRKQPQPPPALDVGRRITVSSVTTEANVSSSGSQTRSSAAPRRAQRGPARVVGGVSLAVSPDRADPRRPVASPVGSCRR